MKPTPQLIVAGILVLLVAWLTLPNLLSWPRSYDVSRQELRLLPPDDTAVIDAARVFGPIIEGAAADRRINPFTLREEVLVHRVRIGEPPPPSLELPDMPAMPFRQRGDQP